MVPKTLFVITTYFLFFVSAAWASIQTDTVYFEKQYQKINQNIREGLYANNLKLIEELVKEQNLSGTGLLS